MRIMLGLALSLALNGCAGYVQGDGGVVVEAEPDLYPFGYYFYDGGHDRDYGRRGAESRGFADHSGGHDAARSAGRPGVTTVVPSAVRHGGKERR